MSARHADARNWLSRNRIIPIGFAFGMAWFAASWMTAVAADPDTKDSSPSKVATTATPSPDDASKPAPSSPKPVKLGFGANSFGIPEVEAINEAIQKSWADHKLSPSAPATDGEWCRRVYLDLIGRIPKVDELDRFLSDKSPSKKMNLVNRLLGDDYTEEYARNWSAIWSNLLIGRAANKRAEARSPVNREGMAQYLRRSFETNKPYDKMVTELVAAIGANKPGEDNYNGAVNFLAGKMDDNGAQATAKTAQIFLGLSVQCTQCHNHPFNEWKQNQFWELNAFFRQTKLDKTMAAKKRVEHSVLRNVDFRGESMNPKEADLFYEQRNGIMKVAYPVFVDGQKLNPSGMIKDVDRRTELAHYIVKSPYMSRAIVNRLWGHFMGFGFTKPVDDMGPHNPPSHPELLETLATNFANTDSTSGSAGRYDLKQLIRWIVLSEPYSLSSRVNGRNKADDPSLGEKPQFSHFYLRQMGAEELYESLLVATAAESTHESQDERDKAKEQWLQQFVIAFGTDDGGEASTFNGSIPQTLMMFNGDLIKRATSPEAIKRTPGGNAEKQINYLYLAGLARRPSTKEIALANEMLQLRKGDAVAAMQDVWWAVLNSNEFILNH